MDRLDALVSAYLHDVPGGIRTPRGARGPCPACGGDDRFRIWIQTRARARISVDCGDQAPNDGPTPARCKGPTGHGEYFYCRQCGTSGRLIDYYSCFRNATEAATSRLLDRHQAPRCPADGVLQTCRHLDPDWGPAALEFLQAAQSELPGHRSTRNYLRRRGFTLKDAVRAGFGATTRLLNGFRTGKRFYRVPQGLVMPSPPTGVPLWLQVRSIGGNDRWRYRTVAGSTRHPWVPQDREQSGPVFITEGILDALAIYSVAHHIAGAMAVLSATGPYPAAQRRLGSIVAPITVFDRDEAGQRASREWAQAYTLSAAAQTPWGDPAALMVDAPELLRRWAEAVVTDTECVQEFNSWETG